MTIKLTPADVGKFYKAQIYNTDVTIKVKLTGWDYSPIPAIFGESDLSPNFTYFTTDEGVSGLLRILDEWSDE